MRWPRLRQAADTTGGSVTTPKAVLVWSADGSTVAKRFLPLPADRLLGTTKGAFANEARVNRLLGTAPPPVRTPALVAIDRSTRTLTFEAVDGDPLGLKFPTGLSGKDVQGLLGLTSAMARYRPRRRWLRRFPLERRLRIHVSAGVLTADDAELLRLATRPDRTRWSFAHGDITARNVLRRTDGELVLIDWEWAGLHPPLYDLAFLWFSLADDADARELVAATVLADQRRPFLVSLVLIESLHLNMWQDRGAPPSPFRARHERQHRHDLAALRSLVAGRC